MMLLVMGVGAAVMGVGALVFHPFLLLYILKKHSSKDKGLTTKSFSDMMKMKIDKGEVRAMNGGEVMLGGE